MPASADLLISYFALSGDIYPLGPTEISPYPLEDRLNAAARAGFTGFGLQHSDIMWSLEQLGMSELKRIIAGSGIKTLEIELLLNWFAQGEKRALSDVMRQDMLMLSAELGIRNIKVIGGLDEPAPELSLLRDEFAQLCQQAARSGTDVVLEIMPFTNIKTIDDALAVVAEADQPNGGLLLDIWHIARCGIPYADIARIPSRFIRAVELDDAPAVPQVEDLWEETIHHRELCGEGGLDVPAFIRAVENAGWQGTYGVEILSRSHRQLPLDEMARRVYQSTAAQFAKR
ncbi:sugar phosphate isomerase/epimerase [Pseudomonas sp. R5(2019)]|uniref:sugar phosphate isomerase/epimerase family protein n=1 Tax=Pseudomonas sp. R5(2019) TaxID=2697566 RepID=UPI001412EC62|nr:sugar phosphate isomerase/epimerase family protein [Pseudomonas sp. R5(2019)]NBA96618.1 TIM barrel protein [Pseudomonas sp. R5(2019)]